MARFAHDNSTDKHMSGIYGLISLNEQAPDAQAWVRMQEAMRLWGTDGNTTWQSHQGGLGQARLLNTPEARFDQMPRWVEGPSLAITVEARLDNRDELCRALHIPLSEQAQLPDSELILQAYLKWGEACPDRLLGDWSFAIWHPAARKLFMARDHHGNTSLCFWRHGHQWAFASDPLALYAAGAPRRLNELFLGQLLITWPAYHGKQTIDLDIERLPPAHAMSVTPEGVRSWRYWALEDTPVEHRRDPREYVEGFLSIYRQATEARMRSLRPIGVTLSGGLDSGSVTALAASALADRNERLTAFTAVPRYDAQPGVGARHFGDETQLASATAARFNNIDHVFLSSEHISPLQGFRQQLAKMAEPVHAASNQFWMEDVLQQARERGLGTLLTGQGGNATVSWTGAPALRSVVQAWQHGGAKAVALQKLPFATLRAAHHLRTSWLGYRVGDGTAIHPDFERRLGLTEQRIQALGRDLSVSGSIRTPRDQRLATVKPGASRLGDLWARQGASAHLEVRDPTVDKRVMTFTMSVPDEVFTPTPDCDRWLIREPMQGLMPDEVRLNNRRGRQSADLGFRMLACAPEVEVALQALDGSIAAQYVDVGKMRQAWTDLQNSITPTSTHRAGSILLRGLMAAEFINGLAIS